MKRKYFWVLNVVSATFLLLVSCSKPEDISGKLDGVWTTQWDDVLKGDVDDIKVEEAIEFVSDSPVGNSGTFRQFFEGEVKFDDWDNESWVSYNVFISGSWNVKKRDIIELRYDLNEMIVNVGESSVEADYTDAGISLLFGDWIGALSSAIKASDTSKINEKIEKEVTNQLNAFFKEMFHDINKDKKGMTDVVIDGNMMTCDVNHGFFGREQVYDRVKTDLESDSDRRAEEAKMISAGIKEGKNLEGAEGNEGEIKETNEIKSEAQQFSERNQGDKIDSNEEKKGTEEIGKANDVEEERIVKEPVSQKPQGDEIFVAAEQPGEFPGGQAALMKWLSENIRYPEAAQQNGIQGRVVVKFIVEKDGSISNAEIARGVDKDLDQEALRVVNKMPKWQPGKNNGAAVRTYCNLPITFKLSNN